MSDLMIELSNGIGTVSFTQAVALSRLIQELNMDCHWHFNDCGCCVTVHGPAEAYVIGRDGVALMFPVRGCKCGEDDHDQA